jgi:hypothetical protein
MSTDCPVCHSFLTTPAQVLAAVSQFAASQVGQMPRFSVRGQRVRVVCCCVGHASSLASLLSEQAFEEDSPVLFAVAFSIIRQRGCVLILSGFRCACP